MIPQTKYASADGVHLAYQKIGDKGDYLIFIPGWVTNVEEMWELPQLAAWLRYLGTFNRLIVFDKRGTGLSDRVNENHLPNLAQRSNDLKIIMKTERITRANILGLSEGGPLAIYLSVHEPYLVNKLILIGSFAKWTRTDQYVYGQTRKEHLEIIDKVTERWGEPVGLQLMAPSYKDDAFVRKKWAKFLRRSASPSTARVFYEMNLDADVTDILSSIQAPTLLLHVKKDQLIEYGHSVYMHEKIPHSELHLLPGVNHLPWFNPGGHELKAIHSFILGTSLVRDGDLNPLPAEDIFTLYEVREHLEQHFSEEVSIRSLSRSFGLNEFKIKNGFRILFGSPVITYLTQVRMEQARILLTDPRETIASVAEKVGYQHPNNFSSAFKRRFGKSPTEYRDRHSG